ncbi:hypothetical protein L4X63_12300 [Geomonas sp. Red32]|nr:hypothetical protein [Geomonas sp. Red32]
MAGSAGSPGSADGFGSAARFYQPNGITTDGTYLYVADWKNSTIRKISIATGEVSTLAGSAGVSGFADGAGSTARFNGPWGISTDGTNLYVADRYNQTIRKVVISTGGVTTLAGRVGIPGSADGIGSAAVFNNPDSVISDGTNLYITDELNQTVRKMSGPTPGCSATYYCLGSGCSPATAYSAAIGMSASGIVRFYSTDNAGNAESIQTASYTIVYPPTISGTPATNVAARTAYSFTPTATNASSFSITNKPSWATFNSTTGALTGQTTAGTYSDISISATNSIGATASLPAFTITVVKATPSITVLPSAGGITYTQALSASPLTGGSGSVPGTFAFSTPLVVPPTAGSYSAAITFTPADSVDYNTVTGSVNVQVAKATSAITALPMASGITFGQALSSSTLTGGSGSVLGTFSFSTPLVVPPTAGSYSAAITFTPADSVDYNTVTGSVNVQVAKATPAITALPTASGITFGQPISSSPLTGGSGSVPGTFSFSTPLVVPPTAGSYSAAITFTPADTVDYNVATGSVNVQVAKAPPAITALPVASGITFGQPLSSSTLTGGSGSAQGTFAFTTPLVVPPTAGTYSAAITFTPTDTVDYNAVTDSVNVQVAKATPAITALPAASGITLGQPLSSSTLTGGSGSVAGTFTFTTPDTKPSAAGSYSAAVTFTPNDGADYTTVSGTVAVSVAPLAVYGGCGSSNGKAFATAPATNLCSAGSAGTVAGAGPWTWVCSGTSGGANASCSASNISVATAPVAVAGQPSLDLAGTKTGSTFSVYRTGGGAVNTLISSNSSTNVTDTSTLLPNTIYQYSVSSDSDPTLTTVLTIHTPLYNGWNIVAVPYETTGVNPTTIFGSTVSSIYEWIPSGATPESSNSVLGSYATVSKLNPGKGYFAKTSNSSTMLVYAGNPGPASATVTLKPGWTMVADPQTNNLKDIASNWLIDGQSLGVAIVTNKIGGGVYWWNGTTYDSWSMLNDNPQIEPWKGYWIVNLDSVSHTLTIQ